MCGRGLTSLEREEISRGVAAGESGRVIARSLGRHYSVVNREVARCGGRQDYRAELAVQMTAERARRPKLARLAADRWLHDVVAAGLRLAWSPRQISARLRVAHPDDERLRVSAETIYQALYLQARGELSTQLKLALRTGRTRRVSRGSNRPEQARITGMVNISERPAEAADRAVAGHWEGDLIIGAGGGRARSSRWSSGPPVTRCSAGSPTTGPLTGSRSSWACWSGGCPSSWCAR